MHIRLLAAIAAASLASAGQAAEIDGAALGACRDTKEDAARLACYDRLADQAAPAVPATAGPAAAAAAAPASEPAMPFLAIPPASPPQGAWQQQLQKDAMSDFESSYWAIASSVDIAGHGGYGAVTPLLMIRCADNRTDVAVSWNRYITSGGVDRRQPVTHRVDDGRAVSADWLMSTNFEATFSRGAVAMLRSMKGAKRLLVSTIPYGDNQVSASFDVTGIDAVIADVSRRCGWKG